MTKRHRILVVDDDPLNIEIVRELLEEDYDLLAATNGEEALAMAEETRPDLVLLDIMMPGISGIEVCRRIKAHPTLKGTKVLLVSAKAMVQERVEGYQAGADDYITKPFDHEEFKAKVRVFLRMKTLEEVDGLKSRILGLLAHETNTPLTSIIFNAEILAEWEHSESKEKQELCRGILDSAWRLHDFLTKGRLLCRFKEGNVELERATMDVAALVREALGKIEKKAGEAGVEVLADLPESLPFPVSERLFSMVLPGLFESILGFAGKGDQIRVHLHGDREGMTLVVEEEGKWRPPTSWADPFDALEVPDLEHHSRFQELDLALCKALVEAHGGTVSLQSTPEKKTVFKINIPAEGPPAGEKETVLSQGREIPQGEARPGH